MANWYASIAASAAGLHTCAITEPAFVRVSVSAAQTALDALKSSSRVRFEIISDDLGASQLPAFVKTPSTIT
ncbi:MAG TPA: hypothetical protein DCE44_05035 [Verrucomicrobiales bacterium]|nr:hypothetical protein [Verrucomicrobiales bacterium]